VNAERHRQPWLEAYGRGALLLLSNTELKKRPRELMRQVHAHVGLDDAHQYPAAKLKKQYNQAGCYGWGKESGCASRLKAKSERVRMDDTASLRMLAEFYAPYHRELESRFGALELVSEHKAVRGAEKLVAQSCAENEELADDMM
jgi:hypothetical protein